MVFDNVHIYERCRSIENDHLHLKLIYFKFHIKYYKSNGVLVTRHLKVFRSIKFSRIYMDVSEYIVTHHLMWTSTFTNVTF